MPIATVRKAFAQLRKAELIKAKDGARTKTKTYQIVDVHISNMVCQQNTEDTNSDIPTYQIGYLDIPDRISADTNSGRQIDKVIDKENIHLITKLNSTKADLIIETEEIEELEEPEEGIKYPNLISFEELQMMRDAFNAKKGDSIESTQDELDLLFVKLWERHSVPQG